MPNPKPAPRPRGWYVLRGVVLALVVLLVGLGVALAGKSARDAAAAEREAASYAAPSFSAPIRVQRVVSVIGDSLIDRSGSASWVQSVSSDLGVQVFSQPVEGGGYVKVAQKQATTFVSESSLVAPGARAVVFFGGVADADSDKFQLVQAVSVGLAEARRIAPNARIVVVGPAYEGSPPEDVLGVRDALRSAAALASVEFVDPISADWTPLGSGFLNGAGTAWTAKGHRMVAKRMESVLAPLVRDA